MANISINQEAIDRIIRSLDSFVFTEKEHGELDELQKIISLYVNPVYESNGSINSGAQTIVRLSKEINGFKTGRTVIPKLLSVYYADIFLPIFNDQDHFLSQLLNSG